MTTFDPLSGPRITPAWTAATQLLNDGTWHMWTDTVTTMLEHSDIKAVTCSNLLRDGVKAGRLQRRGEYPGREVRMFAAEPEQATEARA